MPPPNSNQGNRLLTGLESRLARWMLEHGSAEAPEFLSQIKIAEVTPWQCPCGCASINFRVKGRPEAPPGVHILAEFVFGEPVSGIFIYSCQGTLSGLEVYALAGDAPAELPEPHLLRSWESCEPIA